MLPAEGSQQAPHKPVTCLFISWIQGHIHLQKENLYACVGLNQTQVNISPATASHYNTEAWYFTPAVIIWWEAGNRRDSNKGLYPHSRGHQNWLQADSGRELQKHFQTNLKHLGCKMGDAWKVSLHGSCTALFCVVLKSLLLLSSVLEIIDFFLLNLSNPFFNWKIQQIALRRSV